MGTIFLYLLLLLIFFSIFFRPWITVVAYYTFVLMNAQHIWFWVFGDLPTSKILTIFILLALIVSTIRGKVNFKRLLHLQNRLVFSLWLIIHLANFFAPIDEIIVASIPVSVVLSTLNSLVIVYFASQLLITTKHQLQWMFYAILGTGLYFTYWSNKVYLTGEMWAYSFNGRLGGPFGSIYQDENSLALIFVVSMPFMIFYALSRKSLIQKLLFSLPVPLLWHSIFLTGSRGGLLAMLVTILISLKFAQSKKLTVFVLIAVSVALIHQGGAILNRSQNTIEKAENGGDEPIDPRILSWGAGLDMLQDYPLLGVGTERFLSAYPQYRDGKIHTTHNTFFQIAANNGVFAGAIYLYLFYLSFKFHKKIRAEDKSEDYKMINDASMSALVGFFITSMFLDLMTFEIFYFLLFINIAKYHLLAEQVDNDSLKK
ncbi:MAG: O-antigen ligase family protein [Gammaproteobacteria bacterium]|nr:O-antigen ligase family protein [Gammaproteobacteria bacterium]MBL7003306.1 O-antigen ligase family protein [Gammaproteobacteria bacterium]